MQNYKISVSKENKRYTIIFKAENEAAARERVHKEWYSILSLEIIDSTENIWHTFIFEWYKNWELKHWKIAWDDIFKVYIKLVKNLEYDVVYLYPESDAEKDENYKKKIIEELKEEYELLFKDKKKDKIDELREKIKKEKDKTVNLEQFHMKKELEEVNKLMVYVLMKLEAMITWKSLVKIDEEQKEKLENIYNSIIKLKKSTNISKLKEIWELALQKIWNIELSQLEDTKDEKNRELLNETNKLLSDFGSKVKFIEKDKDFWLKLKNLAEDFKGFFKKKEEEKIVDEIDKESHSYVRTQLYLSKYEEKLRENNKYILQNIFELIKDKEKRELAFLKRAVIKQNIFIYKAKVNWKAISYSKVSKWIFWFFWILANFFSSIRQNLFNVILAYTLIFLIFINFNILWDFNFNWIFLFLFLLLFYILLNISKKIYFLLINFALFSFIIILWVINF